MWKEPIKKGKELFQYIPQRPPFVMVDRLFEKGADYVVTGFHIQPGNLLVEYGYFQEGGLVENIAQSAALFAGLRYHDQGKETPLGFIAGIKNLGIESLPGSDTLIYTKIRLTHDLSSIQVVEGEVFNEQEQKIAYCELRIFIKVDDE